MKTVVATLSTLNVVAGIGLIGLYAADPGHPIVALGLGVVLATQGGFGLATAAGPLRTSDRSRLLLVTGSAIALVAGMAAFAIGLARNVNPATVDPEFGPMTMTLLLAVHGAATIAAMAPTTD